MVNVHVQLPFNLQNRPTSLHPEASSSRSTRGRSLNPYASPPPPIITAITDDQKASQPDALRGQYRSGSPTYGYDHSPSLQTSRSTSSLHPGDASYIPELDADGATRRPILNARLVKVADGSGALGGRKGRSVVRGRLGRFEAQRAASSPSHPEGEGDAGEQTSSDNHGNVGENGGVAEASLATNPWPSSSDADGTSNNIHSTQELDPKITPVGKIARSWGD